MTPVRTPIPTSADSLAIMVRVPQRPNGSGELGTLGEVSCAPTHGATAPVRAAVSAMMKMVLFMREFMWVIPCDCCFTIKVSSYCGYQSSSSS